jgi:hypothetical protein
MAPPVGSEVLFTEKKTAKVYGYTPDGQVRIKDKPGPGRPRHVPLESLQAPEEAQQPLPAPQQASTDPQPRAGRKGWLAAGFVSVIGLTLFAVFNGVLQGVGNKLFDWAWLQLFPIGG